MTDQLALVIEDDPQLSQVFTLTLNTMFDVETIMDGAEALVRLADVVPHLIVLDINLPGASGAQILNTIRSDTRLNSVRVILATADPHQANQLQDKADIVLLKPISPMQLRELAGRLK
jgi:CheY-like chemotaxis protein